ncbi:hypothetical protein Droror1_Dr00026806 [Drosera rotundifolia]
MKLWRGRLQQQSGSRWLLANERKQKQEGVESVSRSYAKNRESNTSAHRCKRFYGKFKEISVDAVSKKEQGEGYLVDKVLDKTGMKGTGKWTVQQAVELSVAIPSIAASLDSRFLSGLKEERGEACLCIWWYQQCGLD